MLREFIHKVSELEEEYNVLTEMHRMSNTEKLKLYLYAQENGLLSNLIFPDSYYAEVKDYFTRKLPEGYIVSKLDSKGYHIDIRPSDISNKVIVYSQSNGYKGRYLPDIWYYVGKMLNESTKTVLTGVEHMLELANDMQQNRKKKGIFGRTPHKNTEYGYLEQREKTLHAMLEVDRYIGSMEQLQHVTKNLLVELGEKLGVSNFTTAIVKPIRDVRDVIYADSIGVHEIVYSKNYITELKGIGYQLNKGDNYTLTKGIESYELHANKLLAHNYKTEHIYGLLLPNLPTSMLGEKSLLEEYKELKNGYYNQDNTSSIRIE